MAKMARERALQERRALKQQKKAERKEAAAARAAATTLPASASTDETPLDEQPSGTDQDTAPGASGDR